MATEPIQAGPYPVPADAPDGPTQIKAVVDWAAPRLNMRFATTAARDAAIPAPTEGMECVTGTGTTLIKWAYVGTGWQNVTVHPPTAYTPVLAAAGTPASGYTAAGRYIQIGKLVTFWFQINMGAIASPVGGYTISLPVAASTALVTQAGAVRLFDSSAGNALLGQRPAIASSTTLGLQTTAVFAGTLGSVAYNFPWSWATGDIIDGYITYEAA